MAFLLRNTYWVAYGLAMLWLTWVLTKSLHYEGLSFEVHAIILAWAAYQLLMREYYRFLFWLANIAEGKANYLKNCLLYEEG